MKFIFVNTIKWENPQPMQHLVIHVLTRVDVHLGQPDDVYLYIIYLKNKETQQSLQFIVNIKCNASRLCRACYFTY